MACVHTTTHKLTSHKNFQNLNNRILHNFKLFSIKQILQTLDAEYLKK